MFERRQTRLFGSMVVTAGCLSVYRGRLYLHEPSVRSLTSSPLTHGD